MIAPSCLRAITDAAPTRCIRSSYVLSASCLLRLPPVGVQFRTIFNLHGTAYFDDSTLASRIVLRFHKSVPSRTSPPPRVWDSILSSRSTALSPRADNRPGFLTQAGEAPRHGPFSGRPTILQIALFSPTDTVAVCQKLARSDFTCAKRCRLPSRPRRGILILGRGLTACGSAQNAATS
jgi:hypothetical protein